METVVQEFLLLQLFVVELVHTRDFWLGALAFVAFLASPAWVWFAYESDQTQVTEDRGFRGGMMATFRMARIKKFSWGPGKEILVDREECSHCLHGRHESRNATVLLRRSSRARGLTRSAVFDCTCLQCRRPPLSAK